MKKSRPFLTLFLSMLCVAVVFAGAAQALTLTPTDADYWGDDTSTSVIASILAGLGYPTEVYKQDVGGAESGYLADYYTTEFFNTPLEPSDATITNVSTPPYVPQLLLVKDGNQSPAWYAFILTGWDGMETINLEGFWPNQGAISHVAMYGTRTSIPEPATLLLLGTGLIGLARFRRKKFKK